MACCSDELMHDDDWNKLNSTKLIKGNIGAMEGKLERQAPYL